MKIAITGGTGFVGRHLARQLVADGHEVVLVARGIDQSDPSVRAMKGCTFARTALTDLDGLARAFAGCDAVAHCAGINRERGAETFARVHVEGTRNVIAAARRSGTARLALVSFLRARPGCGSPYHETKWEAEQLVRESGLHHTVLKCGVIYGPGDHMLDHLSRVFHTFPVFGFVGFHDRPVRPVAVEDVVKLLASALVDGALDDTTLAVVGPEQLTLRQAVRRVARVAGRTPWMLPLPLWFHRLFAAVIERLMVVPMVSTAQVRMLAEGIADPLPGAALPPPTLAPAIRFTETQIRNGLPQPEPYGLNDLTCCLRTTKPFAP